MTIHQAAAAQNAHAVARTGASPDMKAVEFELAIGTENVRANGFEDCVRHAAEACGFTFLFNLPTPGQTDIQRVAAVGAPGPDDHVFVFITLNSAGDQAQVLDTLDGMPHLESFAEAYFDLLSL